MWRLFEVVRRTLDPASPALYCTAPYRALCLARLVHRFASRRRAADEHRSPGTSSTYTAAQVYIIRHLTRSRVQGDCWQLLGDPEDGG